MSVKVHEAFSLDSFQDRLLFFDDFHGDQLQDEWRVVSGTVVVVDAQTGGIIRFTTGALTGNSAYIDWQDIRSLLVSKKVTIELRAKLTQTNACSASFRLRFNGTEEVYFEYISTGANWQIYCQSGGGSTSQDSGVAADTAYHVFRIECFPTGEVHFYIDGTETANSPITTNITASYLQPFLFMDTSEDVAKSMDIDYVYIRQER